MDYTTLANVKQLGDIRVTTDDALISSFITAASSFVDNYLHQVYGYQSSVTEILNAVIDNVGIITVYPKTPLLTTLSSVNYRVYGQSQLISLDPTQCIVYNNQDGTIVLVNPSNSLDVWTSTRLDIQLNYTSGYDNVTHTIPTDFELAVRNLVWWMYKQKSANNTGKTAMPELGIVNIPDDLPTNIRLMLNPFRRVYQ